MITRLCQVSILGDILHDAPPRLRQQLYDASGIQMLYKRYIRLGRGCWVAGHAPGGYNDGNCIGGDWLRLR